MTDFGFESQNPLTLHDPAASLKLGVLSVGVLNTKSLLLGVYMSQGPLTFGNVHLITRSHQLGLLDPTDDIL